MIDEKGYVLRHENGRLFPSAGSDSVLIFNTEEVAKARKTTLAHDTAWSIAPIRITDAPADELREAEHRLAEAVIAYIECDDDASDEDPGGKWGKCYVASKECLSIRARLESPAQPAEQPAEAPAPAKPDDLQSRINAAGAAWADARFKLSRTNFNDPNLREAETNVTSTHDAYVALRREAEKPEPTYYIVARDADGRAVGHIPDMPDDNGQIAYWLARGWTVKREATKSRP